MGFGELSLGVLEFGVCFLIGCGVIMLLVSLMGDKGIVLRKEMLLSEIVLFGFIV